MHKNRFLLHCNNNYCKQDNIGWKGNVKCNYYVKDSRNQTGNIGAPKGFVQNLKDKLVNLQNENQGFAKRPVKKKQKDYYCIMLSKINNLDKKLQNLECLFTAHLNHTPHEILNSTNNESRFDYMNFYESVRSLADVANRLKEDILYKQCDNHSCNRNTLHYSDRIQILDSELQNLYAYLDQLQNCTNEIKGDRKKFLAKDFSDVKYSCSNFTEGEMKNVLDFNESRSLNKGKKSNFKKCYKDSSKDESSCYYEYGNESEESSCSICQCSTCDMICDVSPRKRAGSQGRAAGRCVGGSTNKYCNCSCGICLKDKQNASFLKNTHQPFLSCSCEICYSSKNKSCKKRPLKNNFKISNEEKSFPKENDSTVTTNSQAFIRDSKTSSQYPKFITPSRNQDTGMENVVYFEVSPDILTQRRNFLNDRKYNYQSKNEYYKTNKKKVSNNENNFKTCCPHKQFAANFIVMDEASKGFSSMIPKYKRNSGDNYFNNQSRLNQPNYQQGSSSSYQDNGTKTNIREKDPMSRKKNSNGKHLHIKINNKKEFNGDLFDSHKRMRSPEYNYKQRTRSGQNNHRKHGGFCHFQHNNFRSNKGCCPNGYHNDNEPLKSDSFETLEESDTDSCSSQYKLFFCKDPNCLHKLDSDEVIMLMKRNDLKSCEGNPCQLDVIQNVKDLKSEVCEKCTIKEKTILLSPQNNKLLKDEKKQKVIHRKQIIECSNCKSSKNDKLDETTKTNTEYTEGSENIPNEVMKSYEANIVNNKETKIGDLEYKNDLQSLGNKTEYTGNNPNNVVGNNEYSNKIVACSNLNQQAPFRIAPENSIKSMEVPGFGNMININIERGSFLIDKLPDTKIHAEEKLSPDEALLGSQNLELITSKPNEDIGTSNSNSLKLRNSKNNAIEITSQEIAKQSSKQSKNKSHSAIDLAINSEVKPVTKVKSEMIKNTLSSQMKSIESKAKDKSNKYTITSYITKIADEVGNRTDLKSPQSKKQLMNDKKDKKSNYVSEKYPKIILHDTKVTRYSDGKMRNGLSNNLPAGNKSLARPRLSLTKVKKSRLKYNNKFGTSIIKASSMNSIVVQQSKLLNSSAFPYKRSVVFNPGRRSSPIIKQRAKVYPKTFWRNDNTFRGATIPHPTVVVQESYINNFKSLSNTISNPRYKFESISNYLSSSVISDSSYSTLNWAKVADKLKDSHN